MKRTSWFNVTSVALGLGFLYLPILLLIIYSFNESRLVTVWGGFSTKWYVSLLHNAALLDAAWVTLRVALISTTVATIITMTDISRQKKLEYDLAAASEKDHRIAESLQRSLLLKPARNQFPAMEIEPFAR